jgi:AcrR family transcriptional regulator
MSIERGAVRRTQAQRSEATTSELAAQARLLFRRDGYHGTSLDAIAAAAGVTKGAAYHHFPTKADVFHAVFVVEQETAAEELQRSAAAAADPLAALGEGCRAFLRLCLDPGFRQVVMLDAPAVLGWETVRQIEGAHVLRVLHEGLQAAADAGQIAGGDVTVRCRLLFGAVCEGGMYVARAEDPDQALTTILQETGALLAALARPERAAG